MLFAFVFIADTYAQYFGTSRRVARRTARRTSRRHAAYYDGNSGYAPGYITALPAGCVARAISGIDYQYCSGVYYRPYYQGTQVVYQEVEIDD